MDAASAKVCGTLAIIFGADFLVTSVVRLARPDLDVVLVALNSVLGLLAMFAGLSLWP